MLSDTSSEPESKVVGRKLGEMTLEDTKASSVWQTVSGGKKKKTVEEQEPVAAIAPKAVEESKFKFNPSLRGFIAHVSLDPYTDDIAVEVLNYHGLAKNAHIKATFGDRVMEVERRDGSIDAYRTMEFECVDGWNDTKETHEIQYEMVVNGFAQLATGIGNYFFKLVVNDPARRRITLDVGNERPKFIPRAVQMIRRNATDFPPLEKKSSVTAGGGGGNVGEMHRQSATALHQVIEQGKKVKKSASASALPIPRPLSPPHRDEEEEEEEDGEAMDCNGPPPQQQDMAEEYRLFHEFQQFKQYRQQYAAPPLPQQYAMFSPPPVPPQYAPRPPRQQYYPPPPAYPGYYGGYPPYGPYGK